MSYTLKRKKIPIGSGGSREASTGLPARGVGGWQPLIIRASVRNA